MKKIIVICCTLFLFTACSIDDDGPNYSLEVLPVESVNIPDQFKIGQTYPITVSYFRPTSCHTFNEFYYLKENNIRTVAPITRVFEDNNCTNLDDALVENTFNFLVTSNGSYIFKFWQGKDADDKDQYLTIEVPVIE